MFVALPFDASGDGQTSAVMVLGFLLPVRERHGFSMVLVLLGIRCGTVHIILSNLTRLTGQAQAIHKVLRDFGNASLRRG